MDNGKFVELIGEPAVLEHLAEECCELGHAALKLARIERGENPARVELPEAELNLIEELSDLLVIADAIVAYKGNDAIYKLAAFVEAKHKRWMDRCGFEEDE